MPLPILQRLSRRILLIERKDERFVLTEACDLYFNVDLTANEMRQLAGELTELADNPRLMPPEYQS